MAGLHYTSNPLARNYKLQKKERCFLPMLKRRGLHTEEFDAHKPKKPS